MQIYRTRAFFLLAAGAISFLLVVAARPIGEYGLARARLAPVQSFAYLVAAVLCFVGSIMQWAKTNPTAAGSRVTNDLMIGMLFAFGVLGNDSELLDFAFLYATSMLYTGFVSLQNAIAYDTADVSLSKAQVSLVLTAALLALFGAVHQGVAVNHPMTTDATRSRSVLSIFLAFVLVLGIIGASLIFNGANTDVPLDRVYVWLGFWTGFVSPLAALIAHVLNLPALALVNAAATLTAQNLLKTYNSQSTLNGRAGMQLLMAASFASVAMPLLLDMERLSLADIVLGRRGPGTRILVTLVLLFIGVWDLYRDQNSIVWTLLLQVVLGFAVALGQNVWAGRLVSLTLIVMVTQPPFWFVSLSSIPSMVTLLGAWAFILVTAIPAEGDSSVAVVFHILHDVAGSDGGAAATPFNPLDKPVAYASVDNAAETTVTYQRVEVTPTSE